MMARLHSYIAVSLAALSGLALTSPVSGNRESLALRASAPTTCTAISPQPGGNQCGVKGHLKTPLYSADPTHASSLAQCANLCNQHGSNPPQEGEMPFDGCYTFGYNATSQLCNMYYFDLGNMGFTQDNSSQTTFYTMTCFKCPSNCLQSLGTQLLQNPGFEASASSDGPWLKEGGNLTSPGYNSKYAYACGSSCNIVQSIRTCYNTTYKLTFAYKAPNPIKIDVQAADFAAYSDPLPATGNNWGIATYWIQSYDDEFNAVQVTIDSNGDGVLFDNFAFTPVSGAFKPAANAPELVVNGGFESGSIAPFSWQSDGRVYHYQVVSPGLDGSKYAVNFTGHYNDGGDSAYLTQKIENLVPGTAYLLRYTAIKRGQAYFPAINLGNFVIDPPYSSSASRYDYALPFVARSISTSVSLSYDVGPLLVDNISMKKLG